MERKFKILKDRPKISILLTRDSVCAADDCEAPHEKHIKTPSFIESKVLARETSSGYLPLIKGAGHSWICVLNNNSIAEIKANEIITFVKEVSFTNENKILFMYKSATY